MYKGRYYKEFEDKLKLFNSMGDKILQHYNITPAKNVMECFNCGAEKMGFYREEKTNYLRCKCWTCGFDGDVLDIIKKIDSRFTKKKNKEVLDLVLTDKFFTIKPPYTYTFIPSEKQELKDVDTTAILENTNNKNYIKFYNHCDNNFNNITEEEKEYFYSRGFLEEDLKYLKNYVGIEHQKDSADFNIIFRCTDYSFIRRLVTPLKQFGKEGKEKELRYQNSQNLNSVLGNYCYLLDSLDEINLVQTRGVFYIFEGIFDCLTLKALLKNNCVAFSSGGAQNNHKRIADLINNTGEIFLMKYKKKLTAVLLFDNDPAGEKGAEEIEKLINKDYASVSKDLPKLIYPKSKDLNEELQKNRERLIKSLKIVNNNFIDAYK